ncbi:hypothetical protein RB195_018133 [Necator americanus]|uniref:Uncharacterized protein n=1 Tax=Necator americanus TaxID=51031 RepID=A0ABR1C9D9_NECAM
MAATRYERDIQQRCAAATWFVKAQLLNEVPVVDPHHQRSQSVSLPIRNSLYHDVQIGNLGSVVNCDGGARLHENEAVQTNALLLLANGAITKNFTQKWMWCTE